MARQETIDTGIRRIWGMFLLPFFLFLALSLYSYDWRDIGLLHAPPNHPPCNLIGPVGAWLSFFMLTLFGIGSFLLPLWCLVIGIVLLVDRRQKSLWGRIVWSFVLFLSVVCLMELRRADWTAACTNLNLADTGGLLGRLLIRKFLVPLLSPVGTGILVWSVVVASLVFVIGPANLVHWYHAATAFVRDRYQGLKAFVAAHQDRQQALNKQSRRISRRIERLNREVRKRSPVPDSEPEPERQEPEEPPVPEPEPEPPKRRKRERKKKKKEAAPEPAPTEPDSPPEAEPGSPPGDAVPYKLPPLDLLTEPPPGNDKFTVDTSTTAAVLEETLRDFGIEGEITNVEKGPVVACYELLPAAGVRVERIANLSNNLALALKATSVRVQAPVPGKGVVGIEVPNKTSKMVYLKSVLQTERWHSDKIRLPLALGQDVGGNVLVADLAEMPHLLIAGATGAGKTVCMNSILAGLLMARTPEELRLMLVDPKIVEFSAYNNLPHLVVPVITDPHKVTLGLRWAINEMEKRYKLFAKAGVRNIESYNHRTIAKQQNLFGGAATEPQKDEPPPRIPYIVIVIDELADLMLAAQADIENSVARLAQLSRAVGIHMILSTQRPSVNVITGTIKANFPARIAFQVAQKVDSRTILDSVGAEKLLGRGDMLFTPPGTSKTIRAQGAMTSDKDIHKVVDFIKQQSEPDYDMEIKETLEKSGDAKTPGGTESEDDELLPQAIEIIKETRRASTSSLQRRLRIGYTRAARIMDILEERGIIGPPRGSDPREILIDLDGDIPDNADQESSEE